MGYEAGDWLRDAVRNGLVDPAQLTGPKREPKLSGLAKPAAPRAATPVRTAAPARLLVAFDVPVRTASEANAGGRRRAQIGRKAAVKDATREHLPAVAPPLPCRVTLTRHGVKKLDGDNLARALKSVRDVVAAWLGVDDGDEGPGGRVRWRYRQRPAWVPFVRVRVQAIGGLR